MTKENEIELYKKVIEEKNKTIKYLMKTIEKLAGLIK